MIARRLAREVWPRCGAFEGLVLAAPLRDAGGAIAFDKGVFLAASDVARLSELPWQELHLLELEPGDLHEQEAGARLARAVAGAGLVVGDMQGGQWSLRSAARGILRVDAAALAVVNRFEDLSVYTLFDGQVVDAGETVARAKVIPLVVPGATIAAVEALAESAAPPVSVRPFVPRRVSALVLETLAATARGRVETTLTEKVEWFGGRMGSVVHAEPAAAEVAQHLRELTAGAQVVVVAGSRTMDPLDPAFTALEVLGGQRIRRGVPAHPGSLCWIYRLGDSLVIGLPSCGVLSHATIFDLVLTWVFADMTITSDRLASLGHGGFLTRDMGYRFPPYRVSRERGAVV